ncbi:MAG: peptidylprolyl isomerase [Planctomycetes bacterium]|nr:peptidylprolyl isomerase [Planctomycetota bacterium]
MPTESLSKYFVLLETNRGNMYAELWPEVAPKHVRNYLDLCYTDFYDGVLFHRVGPGFMIQGGDPKTKDESKRGEWGTGSGPRMVNAEFNAKKHVRGVLSMARGSDVNSASCQFFVMHAAYPSLDGKYTGFGMLLDGFETLDKIVTAPGEALDPQASTFRPTAPQRIEHAIVLVAP